MNAATELGVCRYMYNDSASGTLSTQPRTDTADKINLAAPSSSTSTATVVVADTGNRSQALRRQTPSRSVVKFVMSAAVLFMVSSRTVLMSIRLVTGDGYNIEVGARERWLAQSSQSHNLRGAVVAANASYYGGGGESKSIPSARGGRNWDHVFLPAVPAPDGWPIDRKELSRGDGNLTLSTLVPSLVGDTRNGNLGRIVLSMRSETIPADEVVIVVSDFDGDAGLCRDLHRKLRTVLGNRPHLRLVCVGERLTAGRARNVAARLSGGQVLSFVDADDTELPHRNEVTKNLLECYPELKMVVHGYASTSPSQHKYDVARRGRNDTALALAGRSECADTEEGLEVVRGGALYDMLRKTYQRWWVRGDLAHGHVVIRREVWDDEVRFTSLAKGEDSAFVRDVLFTYGRDDGASVFINRPLTSYYKRNQANLDLMK